MNGIVAMAFILLLLLMLLAYHTGVSTDAVSFASMIQNLGYVFTGRDSKGQFVNYPK